jgi:hypothetical protein
VETSSVGYSVNAVSHCSTLSMRRSKRGSAMIHPSTLFDGSIGFIVAGR